MSVGGYKTFGDSISDAGNLYKTPNGPLPPYYHGHFSNGPTWVEDLSQLLGLGTLAPSHSGGADYAVGGARTSDLSAEIDTYAGAHPKPVANALYTLDSGGGDIVDALGDYEADKISLAEAGTRLVQAETNTVDAIESLFRLGARNLLFYEVPNLGLFPPFRGTPQQSLASNAAASFDEAVLGDLGQLEAAGLKVYDLATYVGFSNVVANPAAYGFTNVTDPCWTGGLNGYSGGAR